MKFIIISTGVILFFSCGSIGVNDSTKVIKSLATQAQSAQKQVLSKTVLVDNQGFILRSTKKALSIDFFRQNYRLINKQVIENKHDASFSDTIFSYSNSIDTANFYVSRTNTILQDAQINSQKVVLDNDIKIGGSGNVFKNQFKLKEVPDSLIIKDFEDTNFFLFVFRQNILRKIIYKSTYID